MNNSNHHLGKEYLWIPVALCLIAVLGQVYAEYVSVGSTLPNRVISEKFKITIGLQSTINDLYSWEAAVTFNPNVLVVLEVENGGFLAASSLTINGSNLAAYADGSQQLNEGDSVFVVSYDNVEFGKLTLAETKVGKVSGASGSGGLATVTFGVFGHGSYNVNLAEASLFDSRLQPIQQVFLTSPAKIS